jgi:hypothetical protein
VTKTTEAILNQRQTKFIEKASRVALELSNQLTILDENLLRQFPTKSYCENLKNFPLVGPYNVFSQTVKRLDTSLLKMSNESALELYHKLIVIELLMESSTLIDTYTYPTDIRRWYWIEFENILERIEKNKIHKGSYLFPQDRFNKDLGISMLRLIPAGVRKLHLEKVPIKRFLLKRGFMQFFRGLASIIFELRGMQPVYHGHLDSRDRHAMSEFSQDGWVRHFKMVAELLKINHGVKGVMGLAWFYDPQLRQISPELTYLTDIITENGGRLFFAGTHQNAVKNATALSCKRINLYKEGKYLPANYLFIWPRNKIIKWADLN